MLYSSRKWKRDSDAAATDAKGRVADPAEEPGLPPWAQRQLHRISTSPEAGAGSAFTGPGSGSSLRELFLSPDT